MSATGLEVFDRTLQTAHTWLNDLMEDLQWTDRQKAWRAMRTVFHALRDHLPVEENAHLAAQLPLLLRGVWFEGWRPSATPVTDRSRWNFLGQINDAFSNDPVADAEAICAAVCRVLTKHTGEGVAENIRNALPGGIRELWPAETVHASR